MIYFLKLCSQIQFTRESLRILHDFNSGNFRCNSVHVFVCFVVFLSHFSIKTLLALQNKQKVLFYLQSFGERLTKAQTGGTVVDNQLVCLSLGKTISSTPRILSCLYFSIALEFHETLFMLPCLFLLSFYVSCLSRHVWQTLLVQPILGDTISQETPCSSGSYNPQLSLPLQ